MGATKMMLCAAGIVLGIGCATSRHERLNAATLELRDGMTESEVVALLGPPDEKKGQTCPAIMHLVIQSPRCAQWTYTTGFGAFRDSLYLGFTDKGDGYRLDYWSGF